MKAVVWDSRVPGGIDLKQMPVPNAQAGEVLIRVKAAGICGTDLSIVEGKYSGRTAVPDPVILGHEAAGVVEETGPGVCGLEKGDPVSFEPVLGCGICNYCRVGQKNMCNEWSHVGISCHGAFCDFMVVNSTQIHRLPKNVSFVEGACLEPIGLTARSMERLQPTVGDTAVIVGPGAIGLIHLQVLRQAGVSTAIVVGLEIDRRKLELAKSMGADHIIMADRESAESRIMDITGGLGADLVIESAGSKEAIALAVEIAGVGGKISCFGLYPEATIKFLNVTRKNLTIFGDVAQLPRHFVQGIKWASQKKVLAESLVTSRYSFDQYRQAFQDYRNGGVKVIFEN